MASQHKIHITSMKSQTENFVSHQMFLSARDSQIILAAITVSVRLAVKNPLSEVSAWGRPDTDCLYTYIRTLPRSRGHHRYQSKDGISLPGIGRMVDLCT
jgi:hypothetical protein